MRGWKEFLSDDLGLPPGVLDGAARLTLMGGRQVQIENHRCLLSFSSELLEVGCGRQMLRVRGEDLRIRCMDREALLVDGTIHAVEVENA